MPPITLFFLQASRPITTAWLLEELGLEYDVYLKNRENNKAPEDFKRVCGNPSGKAATSKDGERIVYESGAITEHALFTQDCVIFSPSVRFQGHELAAIWKPKGEFQTRHSPP